MTINRHGVKFPCGFEVVALFGDVKHGQSFLVRADKQEVEVRVTPAGRLRFSDVRAAGRVTSAGVIAKARPRRKRAR